MTQNPTAPEGAPHPTSGYGAEAGGHRPVDELFGQLRHHAAPRDTERRWFGGVCAGVARRFDVDPVLIRAAAIVLAFLGGVGIALYLVLWLILPDRDGAILGERAVHGEIWPLLLLIVTGVALFGSLASVTDGLGWLAPLWFVAGGLLVWYLVDRGRRETRRLSGTASPPGTWPAAASPTSPTRPDAVPTVTPGGPAVTPPDIPPSSSAQGVPMPAPETTRESAALSAALPPSPAGSPPARYEGAPAPSGAAPAGVVPTAYGAAPAPFGPPRPIAPPPPPAPRRRRPSWSTGLMSIGLAVALVGLGVALDDTIGFPGTAAVLGLVMALGAVSLVVIALGLSGRASGVSGFLVIVLGMALAIATAASNIDADVDDDPTNDRQWRPAQGAGPFIYDLSTGEARLDLSGLEPRAAGVANRQQVDAAVGAGRLTIVIPDDVTVSLNSSVGLGEVLVKDSTSTGDGRQLYGPGGGGTDTFGATDNVIDIEVTADLGLGQIVIEER
ncbi:MAG: PspC domain-containing protein [Dermatophilaceae bacterium]